MDPSKQTEVDDAMIELDGNRMLKNTLGANAILGVSMAVCVAAAKDAGLPLYQYIAKLHGTEKLTLPCPMCNVINGGAHSSAPIDFQEFMIAPVGAKTFSKGLQMVTEIFHALKAVLKKGGFDTTVGDEGGFAPGVAIKPAKNKFGYEIKDVMTLEKALAALKTATENAGYVFGKDIKIALDVASSEFCDKETEKEGSKAVTYTFKKSTKKTVKSADMVKLYEKLIDKYSIFSIEDGLDEADWAGWKVLTDKLGGKINLVGDDLFVTNPTIFDEGIKAGIANAILIKVNQVGSVSETLAAIKRAQVEGYAPIVSRLVPSLVRTASASTTASSASKKNSARLLSTLAIRARVPRLRLRRLLARRAARRPNQARVATASLLAGMTEPQGLRNEVAQLI